MNRNTPAEQRPKESRPPTAKASGEVLSPRDLHCFAEWGYVRLPAAFAPDKALAMQDFMWRELRDLHGIQREDTSTWDRPTKGLQRSRRHPLYQPMYSPRMAAAFDQLLGTDNWQWPRDWGKFLISFPLQYTGGAGGSTVFHCDFGAKYWGYYVSGFPPSKEVAQVPALWVFTVFSDLPAHGGGTVLLAGSQQMTPRYIARRTPAEWQHLLAEQGPRRFFRERKPDDELYPWLREVADTPEYRANLQRFIDAPQVIDGLALQAIPIKGEPGDAFIAHPLLKHAQVKNRAEVPRFMRFQALSRHENL